MENRLALMVDLETMGVDPDAAIVSIGAVLFDPWLEPGVFVAEFYATVRLESSVALGGTMTPSTVEWWVRQSEAARNAILEPGALNIGEALCDLNAMFEARPTVWGNGATFDNVILRSAYQRAGLTPPWSYTDDRCFRTFKALHGRIEVPPIGTAHKAIDDAKWQATYVQTTLSNERK